MRRVISRLDPWVPPLAIMAVIWLVSDQPNLSSGLGLVDLVGRKLIHAAEYGLLCFLWWRALRTRVGGRCALAGAFAAAAGYGAVDEYHQTLVEGRSGSPVDVAIDAAGAAIAVALVRRRRPGESSAGRRAAPAAAPTASRAR